MPSLRGAGWDLWVLWGGDGRLAALLPVLKEDLVDVVCGARAAMHIYYSLYIY